MNKSYERNTLSQMACPECQGKGKNEKTGDKCEKCGGTGLKKSAQGKLVEK